MGLCFGRRNRNGQDARSLDGYSVILILILQDSFHPKEFLTLDHHTEFLVKVRIHNHVRNSHFVFQTQKAEALSRTRTLPSGLPTIQVGNGGCRLGRLSVRDQVADACEDAIESKFNIVDR